MQYQREVVKFPNQGDGLVMTNELAQLIERRDWLQRLGLNANRAHELAMSLMQQTEFNLGNFKQRWRQLSNQMGQRPEVDEIMLAEVQNFLHYNRDYVVCSNVPTPPSPPHNLNWNEGNMGKHLQERGQRGSPDAKFFESNLSTDHYMDRRMTSTPVRDYELDDRSKRPDVYNIDEDPRNQQEYIHSDMVDRAGPYNCDRNSLQNYSNYHKNLSYQKNSNYQKNPNFPSNRNNFNQFPSNHHNNFQNCPDNYFPNNTNNDNYQTDCRNNGDYDDGPRMDGNPREWREDFGPFPGYDGADHPQRFDNHRKQWPNRFHGNRGFSEMPPQQQDQHRRTPRENRSNDSFNEPNGGQKRKRRANFANWSKQPAKIRRPDVHMSQDTFLIGGCEMSYVTCKQKMLPQPENESYAVQFFKRKHCLIVGGWKAKGKAMQQEVEAPELDLAHSRMSTKRVRQTLRQEWIDVYRRMNYRNWETWWTDYKWCEVAIDKELEPFQGTDLGNSTFLHLKINFGKLVSVRKLLHLAHLALNLNTTNYQSILGTIFEVMNIDFLQQLDINSMGLLQDMIRHMPNHLWVYKMRSMVYLWARYSRIRSSADPSDFQGSKMLSATHVQWHSAVFHWLAKQAFEELKALSVIEWPEHSKTYPILR